MGSYHITFKKTETLTETPQKVKLTVIIIFQVKWAIKHPTTINDVLFKHSQYNNYSNIFINVFNNKKN